MKALLKEHRSRNNDANTWVTLPGTLLEQIIVFLPVSNDRIRYDADDKVYATGDDDIQASSNNSISLVTVAMVCKRWYEEIVHHQPIIWKHLLDQLNWPYNNENEEGTSSLLRKYRDAFVDHYSIVRDMKAFRLGFKAIQQKHDPRCKMKTRNRLDDFQSEMIYHKFTEAKYKHKNAHDDIDDSCIGIKQWSTNSTIAAYSKTCTLCICTAEEDENHRLNIHRSIYKIDPFPSMKEQSKCIMKGFAVDSQYIICSILVTSAGSVTSFQEVNPDKYLMVIIDRNQFTCCDNINNMAITAPTLTDDMPNVHVVHLEQVFWEYLFVIDQTHEHHPYTDLLELNRRNGLSDDYICIDIADMITACDTNGQFIFEIQVWVNIQLRDGRLFRPFYRMIVIFSATTKSIVWTSCAFESPKSDPLARESIVSVHAGSFAVWDRLGERVSIGDVGSSSGPLHYQSVRLLEPSRNLEPVEADASMLTKDHYFMKITTTYIIIVKSRKEYLRNPSSGQERTTVSFYDRCQHTSNSTTVRTNDTINNDAALKCEERTVYENVFVKEVQLIDDKYLIMEERNAAIIIHLPSRKEIFRTRFLRPYYGQETCMTYNGVMGCCLSSIDGIIMTGSDIRAAIRRSIHASCNRSCSCGNSGVLEALIRMIESQSVSNNDLRDPS